MKPIISTLPAILIFIFVSGQTAKTTLLPLYSIDTIYSVSTRELRSGKIPDSVFNMIQLKHLSVTGMDCDYGDHNNCWMISEIPPAIKNLQSLETLHLTINSISTLPGEMAALKNLKTLDLTDNPGMRSCDVISELKSLEELNLFGCGLFHLPADIGKLTRLRQLGIAGNNFDEKEKARIRKALPNCKIIF